MRKGFPTAVVATTMAGLLLPAVAQANHVASGSATCTLVGNVPTINAQASFAMFAGSNMPIGGKVTVDGNTVQTISGLTFSSSAYTWHSAAIPTTPGVHHIAGAFT